MRRSLRHIDISCLCHGCVQLSYLFIQLHPFNSCCVNERSRLGWDFPRFLVSFSKIENDVFNANLLVLKLNLHRVC